MEKEFPAHIRTDSVEKTVQTVEAHCNNVAKYAAANLQCVGLEYTGWLSGILHDCGKCSEQFKKYIEDAANGLPTRKGSVNHSSAGLKYLLDKHHIQNDLDYREITAELLAYAIGAHHGLFDCVDENHENGFERRRNQTEDFATVMKAFFESCVSEKKLEYAFSTASYELTPILERIADLPVQDEDNDKANSEIMFYFGLLSRLILSALIDADRRDTAEFMQNFSFPQWPSDLREMWTQCLSRVEKRLDMLPQNTEIQKARRTISDKCAEAAKKKGGLYRLNVPTGGGKTLSGLRFALAHAAKNNKKRLIFASPLLSILDQNAAEIRKYIENDTLILEHHSNVVRDKENGDELDMNELIIETWDSPIIITTLVQVLNTMFSGKSSSVRRFHAFCESVIVIDEVQTVPVNMLTLFNLAVNFLSEICGATVVLCSATQPALELTEHSILGAPEEIVPYDKELWDIFHRTELVNAGDFKKDDIPSFILSEINNTDSLLIICNRKDEAAALFCSLQSSGINCFHLSASMCTQHRRDTLNSIKSALKDSKEKCSGKVAVVSTQVIEAGVDISFERVIRFCAGMDSIVQAAGRCNRNGESKTPAEVKIVNCTDESLARLQEIGRGKNATLDLLYEYGKCPEKYGNDLTSNEAIRRYYQLLYQAMNGKSQDYPVKHLTLFDLMGSNEAFFRESFMFMNGAYKTAGSLFTVFDENTTTVAVPYGEGRALIDALIHEDSKQYKDYGAIRELTEKMNPYTVSVYDYDFRRLNDCGAIIELLDGSLFALTDGFYDEKTGLTIKNIIWRCNIEAKASKHCRVRGLR